MNNILFRFEKMTDASFNVLYTVETDDLKSFAGVSGSVSMTLELNVFYLKRITRISSCGWYKSISYCYKVCIINNYNTLEN